MYAKHDKNINRNKSFHPLTYANLRKTEEIQEKQEQEAKTREERRKELHKDQEQRRYDDLVLSASSTGMGAGFSSSVAGGARLHMVEDIFADDEVEQQAHGEKPTSSTSAAVAGPHSSFMAKFVKEESSATGAVARTELAGHKREREETGSDVDKRSAKPETGFITTGEVARLRAEHELVKKQQLDPLLKVTQHKDRTVAEAARAHEREMKEAHKATPDATKRASAETSTKQAIQDILKELQSRRQARK